MSGFFLPFLFVSAWLLRSFLCARSLYLHRSKTFKRQRSGREEISSYTRSFISNFYINFDFFSEYFSISYGQFLYAMRVPVGGSNSSSRLANNRSHFWLKSTGPNLRDSDRYRNSKRKLHCSKPSRRPGYQVQNHLTVFSEKDSHWRCHRRAQLFAFLCGYFQRRNRSGAFIRWYFSSLLGRVLNIIHK